MYEVKMRKRMYKLKMKKVANILRNIEVNIMEKVIDKIVS